MVIEQAKTSPQQQRIGLYSPVEQKYLTCECEWSLPPLESIANFEQVFLSLAKEVEILRTQLGYSRSGEFVQIILSSPQYWFWKISYRDADFSETGVSDKKEEARRYIRENEKGNIAVLLCEWSDQQYSAFIAVSSATIDAYSLSLMASEICTRLSGDANSEGEKLQYADLAEWLHQLTADDGEGQKFWRKTACPKWLNQPMPNGTKLNHIPEFGNPKIITYVLPFPRVEETICLAAWSLCLFKVLDTSSLMLGISTDGRVLSELKNAFGNLSKVLPLALHIQWEGGLAEFFNSINQNTEDMVDFQECFSWELLDGSGSEGACQYPVYAFEVLECEVHASEPGAPRCVYMQFHNEPFFLKCSIVKRAEGPLMNLHYNREVFSSDFVDCLGKRFIQVLGQISAKRSIKLRELDFLLPDERRKLLLEWNKADSVAISAESFHELFERQAKLTPGNVAVQFENVQYTYADLNHAANQIAHMLLDKGATPGQFVGLCIPRSFHLLAAILGVFKSGAAYVPLDPNYPSKRLAYLLTDSRIKLLLTMDEFAERFSGVEIVLLNDSDSELQSYPQSDPSLRTDSSFPAYMIYTSGSTGKPKGVVITHKSLVNYTDWACSEYCLRNGRGALVHSSISFDLTITGLLSPLLVGQKVILVPEHEGVNGLIRYLSTEKDYSLIKLTPSHLDLLRHAMSPEEIRNAVRVVVLGGEALNRDSVKQWRLHSPDTEIVNEYGPTEATVGCCIARMYENELDREGPVSIGKPIRAMQLYVLDQWKKPVPIGVSGELYIGGLGLAKEYFGKLQLTEEHFQFVDIPDGSRMRLYRTGDLARYRENGELEYLGRTDNQVKLRGYRIELGDIEAALNSHPEVDKASAKLITLGEGSNATKAIAAYIVWKPQANSSFERLSRDLTEYLPDYMIPTHWVAMRSIPLNEHGKVASDLLPHPELQKKYLAPHKPEEKLLCGIWEQILGIDKVGIEDNYFELGGDSIRSIPIISASSQKGLNFTLDQLFSFPTIKGLVEEVSKNQPLRNMRGVEPFTLLSKDKASRFPPDIVDAYPLTTLQKGMIYHNQLQKNRGLYHDIFSYRIGLPTSLNFHPSLLASAIGRLIDKHDVLRTTFSFSGYQEPLQLVHANGADCLAVYDLRNLDDGGKSRKIEKTLADERNRGFDIENLPLIRFILHLISEEEIQFSISFHHAIIDGWSDALILRELFESALKAARGEALGRESLSTSFRDYVALELEALNNPRFGDYWRSKLQDLQPTVIPRMGGNAGGRYVGSFSSLPFAIDDRVSNKLFALALDMGTQLKSILLAVHMRALNLIVAAEDITTCLVTSGRPTTEDGERVLGLFINSIPFRMRFSSFYDKTWKEFIEAVFINETQSLAYRYYPYGRMRELCDVETITEVLFYFTDYHNLSGMFDETGVTLRQVMPHEITSYPLVCHFNINPETRKIEGNIDYDGNEFSEAQLAAYADLYRSLLLEVADSPEFMFNTALTATNKRLNSELGVFFADLVLTKDRQLADAYVTEALDYWKTRLGDFSRETGLPYDRSLTPSEGDVFGKISLPLTDELTRKLSLFGGHYETDVSSLLQLALAMLLQQYGNISEITIARVLPGEGVFRIAGMDVRANLVPHRYQLDFGETFASLVTGHQAMIERDRTHEHLSYDKLYNLSPVCGDSVFPVYASVIFGVNVSEIKNEFNIQYLPGQRDMSDVNFELYLNVVDCGWKNDRTAVGSKVRRRTLAENGLTLELYFNAMLFSRERAQSIVAGYSEFLEILSESGDGEIHVPSVLSKPEHQKLIFDWNNTRADYPRICIHTLFERQAESQKDAIAVVFGDQLVGYGELNRRANRLARYLVQTHKVAPDKLIGICLERSVEMVVSILAVLKAGGAYVPLDPDYPPARLAYMVDDGDIPVVITTSELKNRLFADFAPCICLDEPAHRNGISAMVSENITDHESKPGAGHLAYVIYTSGSTGRPKGVMVEHHSLVNRILWMESAYRLEAGNVVLQKTPFSFDVSVWEFFWPLIVGSKLVLAIPGGHKDPLYLSSLIKRERVTHLHFVPSMLNGMLHHGDLRSCASIKKVFCSGEALPPASVKLFFECCPSAELHNLYGPTEASIDVTYWRCTPADAELGTVPIGKPIFNTQLFVLGQRKNLLPPGVPGELHIAGVGLARGYLNKTDLTKDKFIDNPFVAENSALGGRLYKTGDLARWRPDGNIEFLGRLDHQVKVRGNRIELGEIESALMSHGDVRQAVVVVKENAEGDGYLLAYVVSTIPGLEEEERGIDNLPRLKQIECLKRYLSSLLPDYMLPSYIVFLRDLPLTTSGKLDRKALPEPDVSSRADDYVAPRTEAERILCDLWREVLGVEQVGLTDNYLRLGGNSLSAMRLVARINQAFHVVLPLRTLFECETLESLAQAVVRLDVDLDCPALVGVPRDKPLLLSYAQQRLWLLDKIDGGSAHYNVPGALRLSGLLDYEALNRAFNSILERHESLRTCFVAGENGEPVQVIQPMQSFSISVIDISGLTEEGRQHELNRAVTEEVGREFDLSRDLMLRAQLLKLAEDEHILLVTMHHIASDGWSLSLLIDEFSALYRAYVEGKENPLEPLPIQYADYAHWQRNWLQGEVLDEQMRYWSDQLADLPVVHSLPLDHPRPSIQTFAGKTHHTQIGAKTYQSLQALCQSQGATLFMGLHAAFSVLLSRYSNEMDIVIGSPVANREQAEIAGLIGFFVNNLMLRSDLGNNPTFIKLLNQSKHTLLDAYAHQQVPFEQIVEHLQPERSLGHSPLFQIMLVLQTGGVGELELPGLVLSPVEQAGGGAVAKYDLTLNVSEGEGGIDLNWEYSTDLFAASSIERMAGHFELLLESLVQHPEESVFRVQMLSEVDRHQLLVEWNDTYADYPNDKYIQALFEEQVAKNPEAMAVVFEEQSLTYGELNRRANQLAHYLIAERQVGPDTLVGLCIERSLEMVTGILGVLKAGGAYVPLDPEYPAARLGYMLEDAQLTTVLTQRSAQVKARIGDTQAVCLDAEAVRRRLAAQPAVNIDSRRAGLKPDHLAYMIYTSGSTGRPKGVMIEHRSLINFLFGMQAQLALQHDDKWLAVTTLSFDIAALELMLPLTVGASLVLTGQGKSSDGEYLQSVLSDQNVTVMQATPATWQLLLASGWRQTKPLKILCGGEALTRKLGAALLAQSPTVWNVYGPTETTIWSTLYRISAGRHLGLIGRPIANTRVYVLDERLNLQPIGVAGELHIGGDGLGRGYLNQPELTTEKFIPDPFSNDPDDRLYKTGDLVRWLPDGNLEFMGRIDNQVKLRGFRIELAEIENRLSRIEGIEEAAVLCRQDGDQDKRLVAYVVPSASLAGYEGDELAGQKRLRTALYTDSLKESLPLYMVPGIFVFLDRLPLTPNGKINRKALPAPEESDLQKQAYVGPRNEVEEKLCTVWQEVLGVERVGIHDNFFGLGGHSLLAVFLISKMRAQGYEFLTKDIMAFPTVFQLAVLFESRPLVDTTRYHYKNGDVIFSLPNKQNLFKGPFKHHWNAAGIFQVKNANYDCLNEALRLLLLEHEGLRHRFYLDGDGLVYEEIMGLNTTDILEKVDLTGLKNKKEKIKQLEKLSDKFQSSLNLSSKVYRFVLFELGDNEPSRFLAIVHHALIDAYSQQIFMEEMVDRYLSLISGVEYVPPPRTASVAERGYYLHEYANDIKNVSEELDYWSTLPWDKIGTLMDFPGGWKLNTSGDPDLYGKDIVVTRELDRETSEILLKSKLSNINASEEAVIFSAFSTAVSKLTKRRHVYFEVEVNGRANIIPGADISRTIGWFAEGMPVLIETHNDLNPRDQVLSCQQQLHCIPSSGIGFNAIKYMNDDPAVRERFDKIPDPEFQINLISHSLNGAPPKSETDLSWDIISPSDENPGRVSDPELADLAIAAYILVHEADGKFTFKWVCRDNMYKRETVEKAMELWMAELKKIVRFLWPAIPIRARPLPVD